MRVNGRNIKYGKIWCNSSQIRELLMFIEGAMMILFFDVVDR
jgi:hypothetical protein